MAEDAKRKALIGNVEKLGDVDAQASAAMAKSRALDLAVSQGVRQAQLNQQLSQPQQASIVRWERFLPQQQLRVLLVEDDNSTGHVVSALLRNCGYEVSFAPNGVLAWELLMDQSNKVDLVLTEVVMPGLSGIGLLSRIMNHEPLKHVPVIMMSSLDSMGVVFKCLSKGAVDFLVKPVRKNELKNLWQHIWRRCQSSSGSGSGSGSQTQKVTQLDNAGEVNNSGSNDDSDTMNSELNLEGGSDNGSGTQNSWNKKAVEVESSHQGISGSSRLHSSIQSKNGCLLGPDNQNGKDDGVSKDINLADSRVPTAELPFFRSDQVNLNSAPEMERKTALNATDTGQMDEGLNSALPFVNWQMATGVNEIPITQQENAVEQQADSEDADGLLEKHASNSPSSKDKTFSDSSSPSLLKLSLKRPSPAENDREGEVRGTLKRSCSSAFSRYNNSGNNTPLPAGTISAKINPPVNAFGDPSLVHCSSVGSSHPLSIPLSSWTERPFSNAGTDEVVASPPFFKGIPHSSDNQHGSLAHMIVPGKQTLGSCFMEEGAHPNAGAGMQTHFYPLSGMQGAFGSRKESFSADANPPPHWGLSSENVEVQEFHIPHRPIQACQNAHTNHDSEIHHHSHHHHHHHHHHVQHHYHDRQDQSQHAPHTSQLEDSTVVNAGASAPKCGSSNMEKSPEENHGQSGSCNGYGSNGNGAVSLNGSATGSNGGQSVAIEPAGVGNVNSSTQIGAGSGVTAAHGLVLAPEESRHARREAALTKFRQKRKERCFEKKVRYQSRKRLAEQRPRVRGQFVKQSVK